MEGGPLVGADAVTFFVGKTIVNSTELLSMLWGRCSGLSGLAACCGQYICVCSDLYVAGSCVFF